MLVVVVVDVFGVGVVPLLLGTPFSLVWSMLLLVATYKQKTTQQRRRLVVVYEFTGR